MKHKGIVVGVLGAFAAISALFVWTNRSDRTPGGAVGGSKGTVSAQTSNDDRRQVFNVGFLPVTCHLTCPVTDWINQNMQGESFFKPVRFKSWPEVKEAHVAGALPATFMIAPLALKLREDGVPLRIVFLGHRDGTALVVHKDSGITDFEGLRGKRIAVPNRFSNQYLIIYKGLKDRGMSLDDVQILEMPPPEMPVALSTRSVDAIISGEPFMGQAELDGYGRVLYQARELWPNFISCVLVVEEKMIRDRPDAVQELVDGIARSGKWLEAGMDHRMAAAETVGPQYYNQNARLLRHVLSKPPDRVTYGDLQLAKDEFDHIEQLAIEAGLLNGKVGFENYANTTFSEKTVNAVAPAFEPPTTQPAASAR